MFLLGAVNTLFETPRRGIRRRLGRREGRDEGDARARRAWNTSLSLSSARDVAARWDGARAARFFRRVRAVLLTLVAAIALGRARAEDDETVAMGEDGVSVREAALGGIRRRGGERIEASRA